LAKHGFVSIADTICLYYRLSSLSGDERNRLLLVKRFILPSIVLVLDEPDNDLYAETLDRLKALEEELDGAYGRWDELESLAAKLKFLAPRCQEFRNSRKWITSYYARLPRSNVRHRSTGSRQALTSGAAGTGGASEKSLP
jgi:hypothetical protein